MKVSDPRKIHQCLYHIHILIEIFILKKATMNKEDVYVCVFQDDSFFKDIFERMNNPFCMHVCTKALLLSDITTKVGSASFEFQLRSSSCSHDR